MSTPTVTPRKVYVASSWRTPTQPAVVAALRAIGHEVYDFRHPKPGNDGFSWRQITTQPVPWSARETRAVLAHPIAEEGFGLDFDAMQWCDTCVMLQPSGRSAALELGWCAGAGKRTCVLLVDDQEPELMLKCAGALCTSLDEVISYLAQSIAIGDTVFGERRTYRVVDADARSVVLASKGRTAVRLDTHAIAMCDGVLRVEIPRDPRAHTKAEAKRARRAARGEP